MPVYLDELDQLLLDLPDSAMLLSELDGFLTGLIVSPDLISPSDWLSHVWGGDAPDFQDTADLQHFVDLVMQHYNAVIDSLDHPGWFEPIFDIDTRTDETLWELWIEGFSRAMKLAPRGWRRIQASNDDAAKSAMAGITLLAAVADKKKTPGSEQPGLIPTWVELLHEWRRENDQCKPVSTKTGRNDRCPCGSGKKYKKCCGLN